MDDFLSVPVPNRGSDAFAVFADAVIPAAGVLAHVDEVVVLLGEVDRALFSVGGDHDGFTLERLKGAFPRVDKVHARADRGDDGDDAEKQKKTASDFHA